MFNVLLVDDEESILHILKSIIEWSDYNVVEVYTARDGQIALDILSNNRIDLLITDIRMPTLCGLELIEQVKSQYPNVRFILLSAYSEFEYARRAIGLGVENYLLKPIVKSEFENTVKKALNNVYSNQIRSAEQLRNNILSRWITGNISQEELADRAAVLEFNIYLPQYCVVCVSVNAVQNTSFLLNAYEVVLSEHGEVYSFWDEKGRYVLVLGAKKIQTSAIADSLLQLSIREKMEEKVKISIGCVVNNAAMVNLSFQMACDNLALNRFIASCVVCEDDSSVIGIHEEYIKEELRLLLFCRNEIKRREGYNRIALILDRKTQNFESKKRIQELMNMCVSILLAEFPAIEEVQVGKYIFSCQIASVLNETNLLDEILKVLMKLQLSFDQFFEQRSPIVQKACKNIWDSVLTGGSCSIKEFCEQYSISASYLGTLFKSETGFFFNEYLLHCRINRSVILLHSQGIRVGEIASMVGFSSSSYFIQRFKERKGISPKKYREEIATFNLKGM